jgi:hypothetical protein
VRKSDKFSRLSCISVTTNLKFALRFQKMAESCGFEALKVYHGDRFERAALLNGNEADLPLGLARLPSSWYFEARLRAPPSSRDGKGRLATRQDARRNGLNKGFQGSVQVSQIQ